MNNEILTAATSGMDGKWYSHRGYSVAGATTAIRSEPVVRTVRRTPFPSRKATQRRGRLQFLIMSEIKNQRLHAVPKSWTRYNLEEKISCSESECVVDIGLHHAAKVVSGINRES